MKANGHTNILTSALRCETHNIKTLRLSRRVVPGRHRILWLSGSIYRRSYTGTQGVHVNCRFPLIMLFFCLIITLKVMPLIQKGLRKKAKPNSGSLDWIYWTGLGLTLLSPACFGTCPHGLHNPWIVTSLLLSSPVINSITTQAVWF